MPLAGKIQWRKPLYLMFLRTWLQSVPVLMAKIITSAGYFCTNCRALQALASECVHGPDAREQYAGVRDRDGQYVTRHAAEYPRQLLGKFAEQKKIFW